MGGHNLNARVSNIFADETIPTGRVRVDPKGNLLINPKDMPRARGLARSVERNELMRKLYIAEQERDPLKVLSVKVEMEKALTRAEVVAIRPREAALHLSSPPPIKPPNKPPISTGEPGAAGGAGWGGGGRDSSLIPIISERRGPDAIRLKLGKDARYNLEYTVAGEKNGVGLAALTHEDAVDVAVWQAIRRAKPGEAVVIEFDGMAEEKAWATLRTMEIRMGERGQGVELIGRLPGGETLPTTEAVVSKQYDFARASVDVSEIGTLPTGELRQDVSLIIPAADSSSRPLSFTSEMTFNKLTPRSVVSAVRGRVSRAFGGIATRWSRLAKKIAYEADVSAYNTELARAVRKIKARTKLDFEVKTKLNFSVGPRQGLGHIYISLKGRTDEESAPGSTAGQSE
jgi:hypothetical protein